MNENYEIVKEFFLEEYKSKVVLIKNKVTGLEVCHFKNDDNENLFAFAFRTPNDKGTGVAHIIEHSVLCGSELYPLKDPFIALANQSVNTFLNAMTYSDRTVYPASTIVKADYFNLLSVYADAVFFPRLDREIFLQEGHRVEFDENGAASIQGVVYNEMKGEYSDFDAIVDDVATRSLVKGSVYEKDSGGDPLEIPALTYEEFKDFHRKNYTTENCLLFLWGNIETDEILDFLDEKIFSRMKNKPVSVAVDKSAENVKADVQDPQKPFLDNLLSKACPDAVESHEKIEAIAPGSDGGNPTVLLNFNFGQAKNDFERNEMFFISRILNHHSASPLKKALVDSNLGEDISPSTGLSHLSFNYLYSVGLRGVKTENSEKVKDVVFGVLKDLCENGFSKEDIEACLLSCEYKIRNVSRSSGPYSLSLMNYAVYGWVYGFGIENTIAVRSSFAKIKENIENDENYLKNLVKKFFIDNENWSFTVVYPSSKYMEERNAVEEKLLNEALNRRSEKEIKKENRALLKFQQKKDNTKSIPHLKPADFLNDDKLWNSDSDKIDTQIKWIKEGLPFIKNVENTNGLVYMSLGFPVDNLSSREIKFLSILMEIVTSSGFSGMDHGESSRTLRLHTQGISGLLVNEASSSTENGLKKKAENPLLVDRQWLVFKITAIEEKIEKMVELLGKSVSEASYLDFKHNRDILNELKNDIEGSIIPYGHYYVSMRSQRTANRYKVLSEIFNGLTLYFTVLEALEMKDEEFADFVTVTMQKIRKNGSFIHFIGEEKNAEKLEKLLPSFIENNSILPLSEPVIVSDEELYKLTELKAEGEGDIEYFETSANVGFCGTWTKMSLQKDLEKCCSELVLSHWLSSSILWEQIRTVGGAYGAYSRYQSPTGIFSFSTYRDPTPQKSLEAFGKCVHLAGKNRFTKEDCEKSIIGCFSDLIAPQSPVDRGGSGLMRLLFGRDDQDRYDVKKGILNVKCKDIKNALKRLEKSLKYSKTGVIIAGPCADNKNRKVVKLDV